MSSISSWLPGLNERRLHDSSANEGLGSPKSVLPKRRNEIHEVSAAHGSTPVRGLASPRKQITYAPPLGWPLPPQTASAQSGQEPVVWTNADPSPATQGSRSLAELRASAEFRQSLLAFADDYDALGLPPEKGQALRDAVANGTVRVSSASSVEGLNFEISHTYTPNAFGGYDTASSSSLKPIGKPKEAFDANRAMAMWYADYGSVYIEW